MNIFLTGATGFIGANLLEGLLNVGHRVTAIVRPNSPNKNLLSPASDRLQYLFGLFYDKAFLDTIDKNFDVVIHTAAIRGAGKGNEHHYYSVNVEGTRALINFAKRKQIPRFLYLSTVGVLGTIPKNLPAKVDDPPAPDGPYHRTKWEAENLVRESADDNMRTLILRPTITYGPYDNGFLPKLIHFVEHKRLILPKNEVKIHLLSVKNLVRLITQILALEYFNGQTYQIADDQPVELHRLADLIKEIRGGGYFCVNPFYFKAASNVFSFLKRADLKTSLLLLSQSWYYDIEPLKKELFYEPLDTLSEIEKMLMNTSQKEENIFG